MMRVNKYLLPIVTLAALLGTAWIAQAAGYWQTSGREMLDPNQPLTSADIKGWMPLEFVAESYGIAPETLLELLGLPASTPLFTPLKDLEEMIEVSEVRTRVGEAIGEFAPAPEPASTAVPTATPVPAATQVPAATVAPAETATPATTEHGPGQGQGDGTGAGAGATPRPAGSVLPAAEIKGRMSLREVSESCGVPLEALMAELNLPEAISADTVLRDVKAQAPDFEVSRVREVVAALQR
jgi:hypothetical protein